MSNKVYLIENPTMGWYKIGFTSQDPLKRLRELKAREWKNEPDVWYAHCVAFGEAERATETSLHRQLKPFWCWSYGPKMSREYFHLVPEVRDAFFAAVPNATVPLNLDECMKTYVQTYACRNAEMMERAQDSLVFQFIEQHYCWCNTEDTCLWHQVIAERYPMRTPEEQAYHDVLLALDCEDVA